jgi:hypothetical protein
MKNIFYLVCIFSSFFVAAQDPKATLHTAGNDPLFFIDSAVASRVEMEKLNPGEILSVSVYKDKNITSLAGTEARYGIVYITTRGYMRSKYWNYFKSKSSEYSKIVLTPDADTNIQYILDNRILNTNIEGDLSLIDDRTFKGIRIINKKTLQKEFGISGKTYGVIIKTKKSENL